MKPPVRQRDPLARLPGVNGFQVKALSDQVLRKQKFATDSIPVSRISIVAGQSIFLGQDQRSVHSTCTTPKSARPRMAPK